VKIWCGVAVEYMGCFDFSIFDFMWPVREKLIVCMAYARKTLEKTGCKQDENNLFYFC
jgi:hypothetical protein